MEKKTMKKYRIAVGICGPRVVYSNIIKAHSKEEAVEKYIQSSGIPCDDKQREILLSHTNEYESKPKAKKLIIEKVLMNNDGPGSWTGERNIEMTVKDGRNKVILAICDVGHDGLYWVVRDSVISLLHEKEEIPAELIIEHYETGEDDLFEGERDMKKSAYYKAFLYMHSILVFADRVPEGETEEYTSDYGEDVNSMELEPLEPEDISIDGNPGIDVFDVRCGECSDEMNAAYIAEAEVDDDKCRRLFLSVSWVSEVPDELCCEKNKESIFDLMMDQSEENLAKLAEIRAKGKVYPSYKNAFRTKYSEVYEMLAEKMSEMLRENGMIEWDDYDEDVKLPEWYIPEE